MCPKINSSSTVVCQLNNPFLPLLPVIPHFLTVLFSFYSASKVVLPGYFLKFLRDISSVFLAFYMYISQHFICTLCKHFTRLFSNFYPLKSHFLSIRFTAFHCYFLIFTRFCRLRSLVVSDEISTERLLWSTSFGSEGTIFFIFYLLVTILFLSCLFLTFYFTLFILFHFIFSFSFYLLLLLFLFICVLYF